MPLARQLLSSMRLLAGLIALLAALALPGLAQAIGQPKWSELSPQRQEVLKPLAAEWDKLDDTRRKKWVVVADRFSTLSPEEQKRAQARMADWARLTPEQRRQARDNYRRAQELPQERKVAEWKQYQTLPDVERQQLVAAAEQKTPAVQKAQKRAVERKVPPPPRTVTRPAGKASPQARQPVAPAAPPASLTPSAPVGTN